MRTYEGFLALIAELDADVRELRRVMEHNSRAWERIQAGADDPVDWGALGFTIQTAYGILENYFLRVSKFFENSLPSDRWHQALVERMAIEIPGLRPALLGRDALEEVRELVRFRHRLRNLYGEDLDPTKTSRVQQTLQRFVATFSEIHRRFTAELREIADAL
jgi:hypothetical protein